MSKMSFKKYIIDTNCSIFLLTKNILNFEDLFFISEVYNELRIGVQKYGKNCKFKPEDFTNYNINLNSIKTNYSFDDFNPKKETDNKIVIFSSKNQDYLVLTHDSGIICRVTKWLSFTNITFLISYLIEKRINQELLEELYNNYLDNKFKIDYSELKDKCCVLAYHIAEEMNKYNNYISKGCKVL